MKTMKKRWILDKREIRQKKDGCLLNGRIDLQREINGYLSNGRFDLI